MDKQFRLPKEFGEKWVVALRSGKYEQGSYSLKTQISSGTYYCCLGVAGELCELPDLYLKNNVFLRNGLNKSLEMDIKTKILGVPKEIIGTSENTLVYVLSALNDGMETATLKRFATDYIIRGVDPLNVVNDVPSNNRFTFSRIADFIEDNVEFYTEQ